MTWPTQVSWKAFPAQVGTGRYSHIVLMLFPSLGAAVPIPPETEKMATKPQQSTKPSMENKNGKLDSPQTCSWTDNLSGGRSFASFLKTADDGLLS